MSHDRAEGHARSVLVVEDSDDDFDTVFEAAMRARVSDRLIRAADAEVARRLLARHAVGPFAFMLLDHGLPGMDGLAFLHLVRRDPVLAALPAVVFTTSVNPLDREVFCRAGANAFHVKSVQHTQCLRTLASIFERWSGRAAHGLATPAP